MALSSLNTSPSPAVRIKWPSHSLARPLRIKGEERDLVCRTTLGLQLNKDDHMKIIMTLGALTLTLCSSSASAEVVDVDGVARAYFPGGVYETTMETQQIKSYAHPDEDAMVFYTLFVFKDHGETPSTGWLAGFAKGQKATVTEAVSGVNRSEYSDGRVTGEFFLKGKLQGVQYEKVCRFLMNRDDYGSWCVATLGENPDTRLAVDDFIEYGDSFQLLD